MKMIPRPEAGKARVARTGGLRQSSRTFLVLAVCLLAAAPLAVAGKKKPKPQRVVMGEVVDATENPISGAVVEMTDDQSGKKSVLYTQEQGTYEFSGLNPDHDYKIQASFKGVSSEVRMASSYDTRDTIRLNLHIPPPKDQ